MNRRHPSLIRRPGTRENSAPSVVEAPALEYPATDPGGKAWWRVEGAGDNTTWPSKIGSISPIVQADGARKPMFNPANAAFNGRPTLDFDGTEWMDQVVAIGTAAPWVMYAVFRLTGAGATQICIDTPDNSPACFYSAGGWKCQTGSAGSTITNVSPKTGVRVMRLFANGISSTVSMSGQLTTPESSSAMGSDTIKALTVGASDTHAAPSVMEIAEMFFTTTTAVAGMIAYVNGRYGPGSAV